jgi:hypothetical protein
MMWGQARRSEGIMGFDTRMIAINRANGTMPRPGGAGQQEPARAAGAKAGD